MIDRPFDGKRLTKTLNKMKDQGNVIHGNTAMRFRLSPTKITVVSARSPSPKKMRVVKSNNTKQFAKVRSPSKKSMSSKKINPKKSPKKVSTPTKSPKKRSSFAKAGSPKVNLDNAATPTTISAKSIQKAKAAASPEIKTPISAVEMKPGDENETQMQMGEE